VEILRRILEVVPMGSLNFDPTIEFSAMTILLLTRRSLSRIFWPKN
jgi:hypothetical protein